MTDAQQLAAATEGAFTLNMMALQRRQTISRDPIGAHLSQPQFRLGECRRSASGMVEHRAARRALRWVCWSGRSGGGGSRFRSAHISRRRINSHDTLHTVESLNPRICYASRAVPLRCIAATRSIVAMISSKEGGSPKIIPCMAA